MEEYIRSRDYLRGISTSAKLIGVRRCTFGLNVIQPTTGFYFVSRDSMQHKNQSSVLLYALQIYVYIMHTQYTADVIIILLHF